MISCQFVIISIPSETSTTLHDRSCKGNYQHESLQSSAAGQVEVVRFFEPLMGRLHNDTSVEKKSTIVRTTNLRSYIFIWQNTWEESQWETRLTICTTSTWPGADWRDSCWSLPLMIMLYHDHDWPPSCGQSYEGDTRCFLGIGLSIYETWADNYYMLSLILASRAI